MSAIRIVTDSTADLGDRATSWDVAVIPMQVNFGDETYEDGVTIDSETFYAKLATTRQLPTTSQPSPEAIASVYRSLIAEGAEGIVSIFISSHLSGTYNTATSVARMLREEGIETPIEVIDSLEATLGMHASIKAAVQAAREGKGVEATAAAAREALNRTQIFVIADDLHYLQRGGRIGAAQRVVGSLLNVKPIITLRDGVVTALENPRTRRRAYERVAEHVREMEPVELVIVGQSSPDLGDQLEAAVRQVYKGPIERIWAGPTIGTHIGPGASGIAVVRAKK